LFVCVLPITPLPHPSRQPSPQWNARDDRFIPSQHGLGNVPAALANDVALVMLVHVAPAPVVPVAQPVDAPS
jgi:hypothetical protein